MRGYQLSAIALVASLLCGTANAQINRYGDLEMQNHIETMNWLDRRYDQQMRDIERQQMEDRLQRLETSRPIYLPTTGD